MQAAAEVIEMLIFDLDGTLIDSNRVWEDVDNEFLSRRGLAPTQEYTEFVVHSIFPVAAQFTKDLFGLDETPQEIMDEWMALARDAYSFHVPLKPGVMEYLEKCRSEGQKMALFSASMPELGRAAVERLGISQYFTALIFASELGIEKRFPDSFKKALEILGESAGDCTMFDDSPRNCASAKAAGLTAVGVYDPLFDDVQEELKANSHQHIHSFEELL